MGKLLIIGKSSGGSSAFGVQVMLSAGSWVGDSAPYTQTILADGITENHYPGVDVLLSDDYETSQAEESEWGKIYKVDTYEGSVTVYASEIPTVNLRMLLIAQDLSAFTVMPEPEIILPAIGKALNEYTWEEISIISAAGEGPNYFNVGDCKAVEVKGTVGTLAVDATYYVYIIGFNHNGATNTIDFGTFKTAASSGVDICLIDSKYTNYSTDGSKYFNMNHSGNTNTGGWKGCDLRYDVLGSTDIKSSDASTTTATIPVEDTLMAALPVDLRAVMKPMTIYTDNAGGGADTAANVTSSVDYLPLLAEYEYSKTKNYANSAENGYQDQYAYYANGNSVIKYNPSSLETAVSWWGRSPNSKAAVAFCYIYTTGLFSTHAAWDPIGLAPIFRV